MRERLRAVVTGAVQGVGFRPFVYRLASDLHLDGWVLNSTQGVFLEVEGERSALDEFAARLTAERPPRAVIHGLETSWLDPCGYTGFEIRESAGDGAPQVLVLPDIATCDDCLREILDPADRRHGYPFTNCTNCGPRFTIIESLPYDRHNTSMKRFTMCEACDREYHDPANRRFHAQPNACPVCGPQLALWDERGEVVNAGGDALARAAAAIRDGRVVAVKGLGGFHLVVRADDEKAVRGLRARKHREEKPFAVMCGSLAIVEAVCEVSQAEARLLTSPEAPIVLLTRRAAGLTSRPSTVAESVAPRNPSLGVMLPYTPLHHLLTRAVGVPIVATSGNLSDEPICTDEHEAVARLARIADLFLVHDRPIVRHVDDSIVRVVLRRELVLRRARGYAPLPIPLGEPAPPLLAVGAHLKNTVAITAGANVFISQHIGDLETPQSLAAFEQVIDSVGALYRSTPVAVVADLHPDYVSTKHAQEMGLPVTQVQHHYAHVAACMAENDLHDPVLGVSWDGTGYGLDGTVWGGEFLRVGPDRGQTGVRPGSDRGSTGVRPQFVRVATLRPFRLPGADAAIREPRRSALGLLYALYGPSIADRHDLPPLAAFPADSRRLLVQALERGVNAPLTTSAGRLFDVIASLTDFRQISTFEGQAAMELEFSLDSADADPYPFALSNRGADFAAFPWEPPATVVDWGPLVEAVVRDIRAGVPRNVISARFHASMADVIVRVALLVGEPRVVLTGGCFQNRRLVELAVEGLRAAAFRVYWHQRVPPNDGGISLGQIAAALRAPKE